jgi:hypothetical protein
MSHADATPAAKARLRLFAEAAAWLAVFAFMWAYSYSFEHTSNAYRWGSVSWPRGILLIILVGVALSLVSKLRALRAGRRTHHAADEREVRSGLHANLRILGTFLWPLLYLWLLPRTGYYITTPFFIAGYMVIFGQRRWRHLVGTTLAIYAAAILVFTKWLYVPLPTGNWPGFYDASHVFLTFLENL